MIHITLSYIAKISQWIVAISFELHPIEFSCVSPCAKQSTLSPVNQSDQRFARTAFLCLPQPKCLAGSPFPFSKFQPIGTTLNFLDVDLSVCDCHLWECCSGSHQGQIPLSDWRRYQVLTFPTFTLPWPLSISRGPGQLANCTLCIMFAANPSGNAHRTRVCCHVYVADVASKQFSSPRSLWQQWSSFM